jgi:hypothetical protein
MNAWSRLLSTLGLLSACLMGLAHVQPRWYRSLGLDWEQLAEARRVLREERERSLGMDRKSEVIRRRIAAKERITDQLLAGRLTLLQAGALFRRLNEGPGGRQAVGLLAWPGESDGEKVCRQVIGWLHSRLQQSSPSQADEARRRLEGELAEHILRHGTVKLPRE